MKKASITVQIEVPLEKLNDFAEEMQKLSFEQPVECYIQLFGRTKDGNVESEFYLVSKKTDGVLITMDKQDETATATRA